MSSMKLNSLLLVCAALVLGAGCGRKAKEISDLERKQAANLVSEAEFAVTLRDYARAEPLFTKAAELAPDNGEYWVNLGVVRARQGNKAAAKKAYEEALTVYRDAIKEDATDAEARLQEVYVLALLGRADDARKALEKAGKEQPADRSVRMFIEGKQLDRVLSDAAFKEIAL